MHILSFVGAAAVLLAGVNAVPQVNDARVTNTLTTTVVKTKTVEQTDKVVSTITETLTATAQSITTTTVTKTKTANTAACPTVTVTPPASTITVTIPASTSVSTATITSVSTATITSVSTATVTVTGPTVTAPASTVTITPAPTSNSSSISSTTPTSTSTTTSTKASSSTPATACSTTVTAFTDIPTAVASCTSITLQDITVPGNNSIFLSKLLTNTHVTFAGTTFFQFSNATASTLNMITVTGTNVTVDGAPGHVIDGNGPAWWDGQGSNGGVPKPDHFFVVSKVLGTSVIQNLNIKNYPVHCFDITGCVGLTLQNITLDMSDGYAPNARSGGLPAAHNTDGFDLSNSNNTRVLDSTVINQDDCIAITSGTQVLVSGLSCSGSHGLSIGSVGGKSQNTVTDITFTDSTCTNCQAGARIKTNYNTTGLISGIVYENIFVSNISQYGIDIQQDYLNGGPTGIPSNGVLISNITMTNITGTAAASAQDYYILCGSGSCSDFTFNDIDIVGGGVQSMCNYEPVGDFTCDGGFNVTTT